MNDNIPDTLGFSRDRLARVQRWMERYVDDGKLAGAATLIARKGEIAWYGEAGQRDSENNIAWQRDTIARIYSMTKPITAVGLMMLYEQGLWHLDDPVSLYIPQFANRSVLRPDAKDITDVEPANSEITIKQLLTHTSGLSYFFDEDPVSLASNAQKIWFDPVAGGLESQIDKVLQLPLVFQPGTQWKYSVATDVIGRLIEVISGQSLDDYFSEHILTPLAMNHTSFRLADSDVSRFAACYIADDKGQRVLFEKPDASKFAADRVDTLSGGGGLIGTIDDYWRFAEMMRGRGQFDGVRLLGSRTLDFMTCNHLPGELADMGPKTWAETSFEGVGYGLAGSVILNPARAQMPGSMGDFGWGGMASTYHWVDPVEDLVVVYFAQFVPSSHYPLRKELRALVYQALED